MGKQWEDVFEFVVDGTGPRPRARLLKTKELGIEVLKIGKFVHFRLLICCSPCSA
jgi:hypothetical protein